MLNVWSLYLNLIIKELIDNRLIIFSEKKSSQNFYVSSIANIFLKRCSNTKNVFRDSNKRSKNLTSRVVTSVRPIRPDFEFSSGVWLRHPRIQKTDLRFSSIVSFPLSR